MDDRPDDHPVDDTIRRLEKRIVRERAARQAAERLLEQKSRELYLANSQLSSLAAGLEQRVDERTRELAAAREQAVELAERDHLTGLANRTRFVRLLCEAVDTWQHEGRKFALLLIDLDRFKEINDTVGHDAGDAFLQYAAARIKKAIRGHDTAARLGGDEFAVICDFVESQKDIERISARILAELEQPLNFRDRLLSASCSIGFAVFPDDANCATDLQRFADIALYRSKARGRAIYTAFSPAMSSEIQERKSLELDLRQAIARGQIEPWFQPIVSSPLGRAIGAEVLARWRRPDGSIAMPGSFIHVIEQSGLMHDLFRSMLQAACAAALPWVEEGRLDYVSVNVSPAQFKLASLRHDIEAILSAERFPARALQIEITEDALLDDVDAVKAQLDELTGMGVRVALDDFGTGYSSIGYLRRLPIRTLKLDRSLICDVAVDARARAIVSAIGDIASALGMDLVAEGIETEAQALWLGRAGCTLLQGYLFGRALERSEFESHVLDIGGVAEACA
jgi:diguanylate cyclase (GGDEF)-like protein